ncbi:PREDICTED: uncharacterized protein LOC105461744 [Wasmannia auropunctata]|uniref:uncharacterized protein LOC105461744 n=1 Tax=Wasmannia auropunctata TaxID=64793 RepID=UPI0005EEDDEB|nr:PREDICTED: uncharacterized protein LOC105461744 [Wasmannia auropunctata]
MIQKSVISKTQDFILHTNAIKEYKSEINNMHLYMTRSIVISELEKSIITMLHDIHKEANVNLSKLNKFNYLTEEQYIKNKDDAKILAHKCEMRTKYVEVLLYCEKEKLTIAENQKRWISNQLQEQLQLLYDVTYVLKNLKIKNKQIVNNKNEI